MSVTRSANLATTRLKALVGLIDRSLERSLRAVNGSPKRLDEAMRYCVLSGGKRFRPLLCLGVTRDGHPRHPLYVRGDTTPTVCELAGSAL